MCVILLFVLAAVLRSGMPGVREWLAANVAMVVALPLVLLRGTIPDALSVVAANALISIAASAFYAGCARFVGREPRWPALVAGVIVTSAGVVYWRYAANDIPMRVLVTSAFAAAICFAAAALLARHAPPGQATYPRWLMVGMAVLFGASQAARSVHAMTLTEMSSPSTLTSPVSVLLIVVSAATMPMLMIAALVMMHDALLCRARDVAHRDFLTSALTRMGIETAATTLLADAKGSGAPLSLLLLDLDRFKSINDVFGHAGGDAVLREFAALALGQLRRADVLGRMGGEEFAILLPQTGEADAIRLAERLRSALAAHAVTTPDGRVCRCTVSIGVAESQPDETFAQLCIRGDRALYRAKHTGRNRVCADATAASSAGEPILD